MDKGSSVKRVKILIIDNDFRIARRVGKTLIARGYHIFITPGGVKAIDAAIQEQPDVIIYGDGLQTAKAGEASAGVQSMLAPVQFITGHTVAMNYDRALYENISHLIADAGNNQAEFKSSQSSLPESEESRRSESEQA